MTVIGTKRHMTYHELPDSIRKEELESFISNYEWIRREINEDEAIQLLNKHPLEVEDVIYGIHGHMVHIKWSHVHWSVHEPEKFGYKKTVPFDKNRTWEKEKLELKKIEQRKDFNPVQQLIVDLINEYDERRRVLTPDILNKYEQKINSLKI